MSHRVDYDEQAPRLDESDPREPDDGEVRGDRQRHLDALHVREWMEGRASAEAGKTRPRPQPTPGSKPSRPIGIE